MLKNLVNRFLSTPRATGAPPEPASTVQPPHDVARADALIAEGDGREEAGDLAKAEALYRAAIAAAPGHVRAHLYLGVVLAARDDLDGAIAAYEQVLAIDPPHAFGNYNYARAALLRGYNARAGTLLARALQTKPDFPQALILQSEVLDRLGKPAQAIEALQAALRLEPENAGAWFNLGILLVAERRLDPAADAARKAVALDPLHSESIALLARALRLQGFAEESLEVQQALNAREPDSLVEESNELLLLNFVDGVGAEELFRRHAAFGARLERKVPVRFEHPPSAGGARRRLRVGYLSGDFRIHPVSMFLLPVLEAHDREGFELFGYSTDGDADHITHDVRSHCDQWRDAADWTDDKLADAIHADGIDVLVDLAGHTNRSRPGVFCQRPAPVQVAWLGYLNTTGLTRMDFRLSDARCDPPETSQALHTERLQYLPVSQWCYRPFLDVEVAAVAPLERNGYITFGSFNAPLKISAATCRRWGEILCRVPHSRLFAVSMESAHKRAAMLREMAAVGVAPERIVFADRVPLARYLDLFNQVDVSLDPFPYGGGTTTFDSLWMGVPVVAALGSTSVSRSAASVVTALGLESWVAPRIEDFVDVAVARASEPGEIVTLRRTLRARLQQSPLTDALQFTRALESAYREMACSRTC